MLFRFKPSAATRDLHSFPTRRSSDLVAAAERIERVRALCGDFAHARSVFRRELVPLVLIPDVFEVEAVVAQARERRRSEEHTSELQSPYDLVCRLLLEKKNN